MTWEDVPGFHGQAFEIGAHTVNHVDLGVVDMETTDVDIHDSREKLEHELSAPIRFFSFLFGSPSNITEANLERVRAEKSECCVSAFGGLVAAGTHAFRAKRTAIARWFLSPYQFGFEVMRLRKVALPAST